MSLPAGFSSDGLLAPGDYELTLEELRSSWLVCGPSQEGYAHWDREWRARLVGIRDRFGNELEFPSAFRLSRRDGKPRKIVKIGGAP